MGTALDPKGDTFDSMSEKVTEHFDLYYTYKSSSTKKMNIEMKQKMIEAIKKLDTHSYHALFMLIVEHAKKTNDHQPTEIYWKSIFPYNGMKIGYNIQFDLNKFPGELQWIIYKFLKI
jgi:hypothetical protein